MEANELREWRNLRALTLDELSEHLCVDRKTLWRWEMGRFRIPAYLERALRDLDREISQQDGSTKGAQTLS